MRAGYRLSVTWRVLAAAVGGFACTSGLVALAAVAAIRTGLATPAGAVSAASAASFAIWCAAALWAFHARGARGGFRASMTWLHAWAGLLFAFVLYFMFLTGTAGYFHYEITYWMEPERRHFLDATDRPQPELADLAVAHLREAVPAAEYWYVSFPLGERDATRLYAFAEPVAAEGAGPVRDHARFLDAATGAVDPGIRDTAGGDTLYFMHYVLHYMPDDWALYVVGIAAMFLLVALVSGIVAHARIFADFFTFKPGRGPRTWLDAHKLSAVLALPFMLVIAYSGLLMYTYEYMPAARAAVYGADEARFERERLGQGYHHTEPAGRRAATVPIGELIRRTGARWGTDAIMGFEVVHPDDANARVAVFGRRQGQLDKHYPEAWYDGATGAFIEDVQPPRLAGETFSNVLFGVHEGNYATPLLRWLYLLTGLAGAGVIATGQIAWTRRRRQKVRPPAQPGAGLVLVERLNVGLIAGLPIGIAAYFWSNRLLPATFAGRAEWEVNTLFVAWGLMLLHAGLRRNVRQAWREQLAVLAGLLLLLPVVNAVTTDVHLAVTLRTGDWVRAGFDLTMLALGLAAAAVLGKLRSGVATAAPAGSPAN